MSWFKSWWKRFRCLHDYQYDRTLYGDKINHYKHRNIYRCALCGKEYPVNVDRIKEPYQVTFPFPDSLAVIVGKEIWCGTLTRFSECKGFIPEAGTVSEWSTSSTQRICRHLEPDTGRYLKYPRDRSR